MHHSKIANQMPQNCKSFLGLMNEAADLNLQYGRTTEALVLFRQIGDAHLGIPIDRLHFDRVFCFETFQTRNQYTFDRHLIFPVEDLLHPLQY
jgi:hypothetical protein